MTQPHMPEVRPRVPSAARVPRARWFSRRRRDPVVRRGLVATVLAPLAAAVAVVLVVLGLVAIGTNWWAGYSRDQVFKRAVQPDGSRVEIATGPPLEETVTILLRDDDGELRRLVVERNAADRFVNETLRLLDRERQRISRLAAAEVASLMADAFADADLALERHADWFFSWKRSYVVLKEAAVATATRLLEPGDYEPLHIAVARDLEDYFLQHYLQQVLAPELRGPAIDRDFEAAARRAQARWLAVLAQQDRRLQRFLERSGRRLDTPRADGRLSSVTLDWDAQRFKARHPLTADKAFDGALGLARVGGGSMLGAGIGASALGPVVERTGRRVVAGLVRRQVLGMGGRLAAAQGGAALGTVVQPVAGTAIGAVAGGLLGLAVDYAVNEADAARNREAFIVAHRAALAVTVAAWKTRLTRSLEAAIDRWFADARAAVVRAD